MGSKFTSVFVARFPEASAETIRWKLTWDRTDPPKWLITQMRFIQSCLFCRLFLLVKNGVENCDNFLYKNVPKSCKYSFLPDLNHDAEMVLNLDICKRPRFPDRLWTRRHYPGSISRGGCPVDTWQLLSLRLGSGIVKDDKWQSWRTRGEIGRLSWNTVTKCDNSTWTGFSNSMCRNFWCIWYQITELHLQEGVIPEISLALIGSDGDLRKVSK